jgi:hypothetical protein
MPTFAVTVTAGTWWNTAGVNSNESRTKLAPAPTRADASNDHTKRTDNRATPPTTQNGRLLSATWLRVSEPLAPRRPIKADAQGRASSALSRKVNGQASKLAASSVNAATPPCAGTWLRHACDAPSKTAGDQSAGRSMPISANNATPGMAPGAGPKRAWPASWKPKVWRPRALEGSGSSSSGARVAGSDCDDDSAGFDACDAGGAAAPGRASPGLRRVASVPVGFTSAVGSSVTAMISATASAASRQLAASTRRAERGLPGAPKTTLAITDPDGATENRARTPTLPDSSNFTRGARVCTRAIKSSLVAQSTLASTSRRALGTSDCATASRNHVQLLTTATSNDARRARAVGADGNLAP